MLWNWPTNNPGQVQPWRGGLQSKRRALPVTVSSPPSAPLTLCLPVQQVKGYLGPDNLAACLEGADLVVIPAGVPRKPGMTRDDLFNINAGIVKNLAQAAAKHCPNVSTAVVKATVQRSWSMKQSFWFLW